MRRAGNRRQPLTPHSPTPLLGLSHLIRPAALMSPSASCPGPSPRLCFASVQRRAGWGLSPCAAAAAPPPPPRRARHRAPGAPRRSPRTLSSPASRRLSPSLLPPPADSASRVTPPRVPSLPPALNPPSDQVPRWGNHPSRWVFCRRSRAAGTAQRGQLRRGVDTPSPSRARSSSRQSPSLYTGRLLAAHRDRREPSFSGVWSWWVPGATGPPPPPLRLCAGPRASAAAHGLKAQGGRAAQGRVRGKRDHTHFKIHLLQFFKFFLRPVPEPRGTEVLSLLSLAQTPRSNIKSVSEALYV